MTVSVALPVLNGGALLDEVLLAVRAQKIAAELEIVVVDSGSDDGSREVAALTARLSTRSSAPRSRTAARATC